MPGDDVVPRAQFNATRSISIDAAPKDVWPWIVQLGYRRAGFYTYDQVDNASEPSADRIIEEYQDLKIGDEIRMWHGSYGLSIAYVVDSFEHLAGYSGCIGPMKANDRTAPGVGGSLRCRAEGRGSSWSWPCKGQDQSVDHPLLQPSALQKIHLLERVIGHESLSLVGGGDLEGDQPSRSVHEGSAEVVR